MKLEAIKRYIDTLALSTYLDTKRMLHFPTDPPLIRQTFDNRRTHDMTWTNLAGSGDKGVYYGRSRVIYNYLRHFHPPIEPKRNRGYPCQTVHVASCYTILHLVIDTIGMNKSNQCQPSTVPSPSHPRASASRLVLDEYPIHVLPRRPLPIPTPMLHVPRFLPL